jgi:hypothetical protein
MAFLLLLVLDYVYEPDPQECVYYKFTISGQCRQGNGVEFMIKNEANKELRFLINGKNDQAYSLPVSAQKKIIVSTTVDKYEIVPYLTIAGQVKQCRGKMATLNKEVLIKC